jgi:hypothetical protein
MYGQTCAAFQFLGGKLANHFAARKFEGFPAFLSHFLSRGRNSSSISVIRVILPVLCSSPEDCVIRSAKDEYSVRWS